MRYYHAELAAVAVSSKQYPEANLPEIAFVGRSNVGKSSLLNKLLNRRGLARVSATPGKTQTINFFRVDGKYYYTDLPGYGFAKVSKDVKRNWEKMIEDYLRNRQNRRGIVFIVDVRHSPTNDDLIMWEWLKYFEIPTVVVANKMDKIPRGKWKEHFKIIRESLGVDHSFNIFGVSSRTGQGISELRNHLFLMMGISVEESDA